MVMSPRTTISGTAAGLPTLSEQAMAAASPTATPLGMPLALHEEVLRANFSLACKLHVYDRELFKALRRVGVGASTARSTPGSCLALESTSENTTCLMRLAHPCCVCWCLLPPDDPDPVSRAPAPPAPGPQTLELRLERLSGKHTGKSRRTRLLQHVAPADSASPHSERDGAGSDTHGTPGTEGAGGAVTQWPSARRGEESAEFAAHAAALVAGLIIAVIAQSPQGMRTPELLTWIDAVKVGPGRTPTNTVWLCGAVPSQGCFEVVSAVQCGDSCRCHPSPCRRCAPPTRAWRSA
jgi:hypothetical protein